MKPLFSFAGWTVTFALCVFTFVVQVAALSHAAESHTEGRTMLPPAKFSPPAAVVVSECGSIVGVAFTDASGGVTDFPTRDVSFASALLFINRAGKILRYDLPCR